MLDGKVDINLVNKTPRGQVADLTDFRLAPVCVHGVVSAKQWLLISNQNLTTNKNAKPCRNQTLEQDQSPLMIRHCCPAVTRIGCLH